MNPLDIIDITEDGYVTAHCGEGVVKYQLTEEGPVDVEEHQRAEDEADAERSDDDIRKPRTNRVHGFVIRFYDRRDKRVGYLGPDDDYHAVSDLAKAVIWSSRKKAQIHLDRLRANPRHFLAYWPVQTVEIAFHKD